MTAAALGVGVPFIGALNMHLPRPKLALDFLTPVLDGRITASGGANGTRVNSSGLIVAATTPRFDYDPVTLDIRGLLVEEARTNLLLYSDDFTGAAWATQGTANVTANTVQDTDAATASNRYQDVTIANDSSTRVAQWRVAKNQAQIVALQHQVFGGTPVNYAIALNTATGAYNTASTLGSDPGANATVTDAGGFWLVTIVLANNSTGNTTARQRFYPAYASSLGGGSTVADVTLTGTATCRYMGLELGSFATSYIPTAGSAVTRTADSLTMTGTNFSSWFNASEGTFLAEFQPLVQSIASINNRYLCQASNGTISDRVGMCLNPNGTLGDVVETGWVLQVLDSSVAAATTSINKAAVAYAANNVALCLNGATPVVDSSATMPSGITQLNIGAALVGAEYLGGHLRSLRYYNKRLPNAHLQGLTL